MLELAPRPYPAIIMLKKSEKLHDKQWLYEQYWGKIRSTSDIADEVGVESRLVLKRLNQHGIPRRPKTWERPLAINPLEGFEIEREQHGRNVADCPEPRGELPNCLNMGDV